MASAFIHLQVSRQHTVYNMSYKNEVLPTAGATYFSFPSQASLTQEAESTLPRKESLIRLHTYTGHNWPATLGRGDLPSGSFRRQAWLKWQSQFCRREDYGGKGSTVILPNSGATHFPTCFRRQAWLKRQGQPCLGKYGVLCDCGPPWSGC